jgi:hypothetical protein
MTMTELSGIYRLHDILSFTDPFYWTLIGNFELNIKDRKAFTELLPRQPSTQNSNIKADINFLENCIEEEKLVINT